MASPPLMVYFSRLDFFFSLNVLLLLLSLSVLRSCTCHSLSHVSPSSVSTVFFTLWTLCCPFTSPPTRTICESTACSRWMIFEWITEGYSAWLGMIEAKSGKLYVNSPGTLNYRLRCRLCNPNPDLDTLITTNNQRSLQYRPHGCIFC